MQEHIRRAHPDHYIPKLPANEESFLLMIKTAPSEKPKAPVDHVPKTSSLSDLFRHASPYADNVQASTYEPRGYRDFDMDEPIMPNSALRRPSMLPAATALADLHNARIDHDDWDTDQIVCDEPLAFYNGSSHLQDGLPQIESDTNYSLQTYLGGPLGQDAYRARMPDSPLPKNVSPTELMRQPLPLPNSSRASSAQPFPRVKVTKPRKASITEHARRGKHEREREREYKRFSHGPQDRHLKAPSVETSSLFGNKWEDLLEAAASASEADCRSRDLTPVRHSSICPDLALMANRRYHHLDLLSHHFMACISRTPTQLHHYRTAYYHAHRKKSHHASSLLTLNHSHLLKALTRCIHHHLTKHSATNTTCLMAHSPVIRTLHHTHTTFLITTRTPPARAITCRRKRYPLRQRLLITATPSTIFQHIRQTHTRRQHQPTHNILRLLLF